MTVIKLVVVPALAWGLAEWFDLSGMYRTAAIVLATLPTASSAYILAVRMGGDGKLVASIITMNIFVGMLTLPLWLAFTL
jgi:predicted permease